MDLSLVKLQKIYSWKIFQDLLSIIPRKIFLFFVGYLFCLENVFFDICIIIWLRLGKALYILTKTSSKTYGSLKTIN